MGQLIIIANVIAKSDKVDFVKAELEKLVVLTRSEEGCLQYDLHQDNENSAHFMVYEYWESRELWQVHIESKHLKDYIKVTESVIDSFTVNQMSKI